MKTMTCRQLAGACDEQFHAETFDEMGEMSRKHAMEMVEQGEKGHIEKMEEMKTKGPEAGREWFEQVQREFDALPED